MYLLFRNFNSIKVRLEQIDLILPGTTQVHFNSIKVRLEPSNLNLCLHLTIFQFHKGTIRT